MPHERRKEFYKGNLSSSKFVDSPDSRLLSRYQANTHKKQGDFTRNIHSDGITKTKLSRYQTNTPKENPPYSIMQQILIKYLYALKL